MRSYKLVFDGSDNANERFSLLYQGFVNGGNAPMERKNMEVFRREAKILDKLEESSELIEGRACESCGQAIPGTGRQVPLGDVTIVFDQPEMALVKKYVEQTQWTTRMSRKVVDLIDWLATITPEGG